MSRTGQEGWQFGLFESGRAAERRLACADKLKSVADDVERIQMDCTGREWDFVRTHLVSLKLMAAALRRAPGARGVAS